jgi:tetratricopeptide (TPR) repeat protein
MESIKIQGIYFERKIMTAGVGATVQEKTDDLHYFVRELPDSTIRLELLKGTTSTGMQLDVITKEEFAKRFRSCSEHDCPLREKTPEEKKKLKHNEIVKTADEHLKKKEYNSAEFEYGRAIKLDEDSVRANYGMGKVYVETGRIEEAKQIFKKLSQTEALFEEENKHLFNEFGIDLRKQGMYDEAIVNYEKAVSIAPKDETLYYNLGRAYKEKGDYKTAYEKVKKALEIKPDFKEAQEYLEFLRSKANK